MKIKTFKIFENSYPDIEMVNLCEDLFLDLEDDGFSIDISQVVNGGVEIIIFNGYDEDDDYKPFEYKSIRYKLVELFSHNDIKQL
jgi:hypothetical protein